MSITTYAELQTAVADWLNRTDLTAVVPSWIALAEARFRRDPRVRRLQDRGGFTISSDDATLPTDMQSLGSWYHDGPSSYGPIEIVGPDQIGILKGYIGDVGTPRYAALVNGVAKFAPEPDGTYATVMTYWRTVESLSNAVTTNWLLDSHPDIYLYGALAESAMYLKDEQRLGQWEALLEARLEALNLATWNQQWGGSMRRVHKAIGG